MFEQKNEEIVNDGINVVIHFWPESGSHGVDLYNLSIFSQEKGTGTRYSDIMKKIVVPFHKIRLDSIQAEFTKQKEIDVERLQKSRNSKKREEAQIIASQNLEKFNGKQANPLHGIPKEEFDDMMKKIGDGFKKSGLKVNEEVCKDQFNLEMGMTYHNYV